MHAGALRVSSTYGTATLGRMRQHGPRPSGVSTVATVPPGPSEDQNLKGLQAKAKTPNRWMLEPYRLQSGSLGLADQQNAKDGTQTACEIFNILAKSSKHGRINSD